MCSSIYDTIFNKKTPSNFLNIDWEASPEDAVAIIISEVEKAGIEYFVRNDRDRTVIGMLDDPFFGQSGISPAIIVDFSGENISEISCRFLGSTSRDYESVVQNVTKVFGKPDEAEMDAKMEQCGGYQRSTWHLDSTDIVVSRMLSSVSVKFIPHNN